MIRCILATILIIASFVTMAFTNQPYLAWAYLALAFGLILWYCDSLEKRNESVYKRC